VAKINPVKLKQDADKEEKTGRFDKAIDLLKQIVAENPRDWNTINRIGDLYVKLNNLKAANEQYGKVADFYTTDGFYLKAIAVWKKVQKNDPSDLSAKIKLGDLYAKQGLAAEAKQTYNEVFDEYVKRNRIREAGDVLQRIAHVDPSDLKVRIRLADLFAREGRKDKAAAEYVAIADELVKKGHLAEALLPLEKGLKLDPRNPKLLSEIARVHLAQKDFAKAVGHLEEARRGAPDDREVALRLAEGYLGAKRPDAARAVLQELLGRDPADQDARLQLGRVYLAEGRYDEAFDQLQPAVDRLVERRQIERAAGLLQQVVQRNPSHVRTLAKLVELYRQSRNDQLVAQTYSQMVEAYLGEGQLDNAASVLDILVQLEPTNEQHQTKLAWVRRQLGEPAAAPAAGAEGFEDEFLAAAPPPPAVSAPPLAPARPVAVPRLELSGPLSAEDKEFIDEHLAEGRVFRKYGLGDKARDQFEAVLSRFPDNIEARQELRDLHKDKGENAKAAEQLQMMAEIFRLKGDGARAAQVEAEASALGGAPAPVAQAAPALAAPVPVSPAPARPAPARPSPAPPVPTAAPADLGVEIAIEEPAHDEEEFGLVEVEETAPPEREEPAFDESELGLGPAGGEGEIGSHFIDEEPGPFAAAAEAPFDLEIEEAPRAAVPAATVGLVPQAKPSGAQRSVPPELQRVLEEVESYVSLGFVDDAKDHLAEVGARFAGHPALVSKLAELGLETPSAAGGTAIPKPRPAAAPPIGAELGLEEPLQLGADLLEFTPTTPASLGEELADLAASETPAPPEAEAFDLASELGDLFGAQPAVAAESPLGGTDLGDTSLADIFREFQKGVDKQLGKEDYETRYNLGIAYKEMGLIDEAIAEFQLAAKDESRLFESTDMLGHCFVEKGMPKLAVKWFERGLSAPGRTDHEYMGIRYDLADALERADELEEALALFEEVFGQDASFRDVAERIKRLREKIRQRGASR
jgi:tetratricopeptide (TPR) repeat protein